MIGMPLSQSTLPIAVRLYPLACDARMGAMSFSMAWALVSSSRRCSERASSARCA